MPQVYCFKKDDYVDSDSCFEHYKQALANGLKLADSWEACQRENLGKDLFSMSPEQKAEMERMNAGQLTESEEKEVKASFEDEGVEHGIVASINRENESDNIRPKVGDLL